MTKYEKEIMDGCIRIRDIPKEEQESFKKFMNGQTMPYFDSLSIEDNDFVYKCDYENFKAKGKLFFD
jgi:hypothetical protein